MEESERHDLKLAYDLLYHGGFERHIAFMDGLLKLKATMEKENIPLPEEGPLDAYCIEMLEANVTLPKVVDMIERRYIEMALLEFPTKLKTAKFLGVGDSTLRIKINKHGLDV